MKATDEQIGEYRKKLNDLTVKCSDKKPESRIREELKKLAWEVGASTQVLYVSNGRHTTGDADTSEIIRNIHQALQTASMANMCRSARQGYDLATEASNRAAKNFKWLTVIAILSTLAAVLSAVAAWIAAVRN